MQLVEQMPTRGYQSSVSPVLHFGLGDQVKIDSLKITWPDQSVQVLIDVRADQILVLDQKNAQTFLNRKEKSFAKSFVFQKPLIDYSHLQIQYNDFKRQPLMPVMLSPCGPKFAIGDLNGGNDIGLYATHQMNLQPLAFFH